MDTDRWLLTWVLFLVLATLTSAGPDPWRREFGDVPARRRLSIATFQSSPYLQLNWTPGLIGNERYEGYHVDLISQLADLAGFDYQFHLVADGNLGNRGEDGSWNGLVGELLSGNADLTLGPLSISRERQAAVDFTSPLEEVKLTIIMAKDPSTTTTAPVSLPDLLARQDLKFVALRSSDALETLRTSLDSNLRGLYRRLQQAPITSLVSNMFEALEKVRTERYALVLDSPLANYYVGREPCDLATVATFHGGRQYALAARRGDQIVGEINRALQALKSQTSSWRRRYRKWWQPKCPGMLQDNSRKQDTAPAQPSTSVSPLLQLRLTADLNRPFVMTAPDGRLTGYTVDLLDSIAELVPFRYEISFPKDGKGFGKRKRGQWTGMVGELLREEADLAAAPFTSNRQRNRVLSYTKPFLHSTLSLLTRVSFTSEDMPIFFMEDLLNQTGYQYGVLKGSHLEKELKSSRESVPQQIWANIVKDKKCNLVQSLEKGVEKVRTERFVLILPSTYATYLSSKAPCDLMALDQFMFITNYMFAVRKGNRLVEKIDEALLKLQQDGVLQMLFHKWWNTGDCVGATDPTKVVNATEGERRKHSSIEWIHSLFTFSTRFKGTASSPPADKVNPTPSGVEETTSRGISVSPQPAALSSQRPDTIKESRVEDGSTISKFSVARYGTPTAPSNDREGRRRKNRNRHRHRHRHGERERGGDRDGAADRITLASTQTATTRSRKQETIEPSVAPWPSPPSLPTAGSVPGKGAAERPLPATWDGKYILDGGFLSTDTPDNYTVNLELIPAEHDSIRIFPFTYRPKTQSTQSPSSSDSRSPAPTVREPAVATAHEPSLVPSNGFHDNYVYEDPEEDVDEERHEDYVVTLPEEPTLMPVDTGRAGRRTTTVAASRTEPPLAATPKTFGGGSTAQTDRPTQSVGVALKPATSSIILATVTVVGVFWHRTVILSRSS